MFTYTHPQSPAFDRGEALAVPGSPTPKATPALADGQSGVELTKKGEKYVALVEASGVFFLTLSRDRASIAYTIERLINMLDDMEEDPDIEPDSDDDTAVDDERCDPSESGDDEPAFGWEAGSMPYNQAYLSAGMYGGLDEIEDENEHGGDILDEPHDEADQGDREPFLGWSEQCSQGRDDPSLALGDPVDDASDSYPIGLLAFDGDGYHQANEMLRKAGHDRVRVSPGYGWF
ncbi:hypothetical protein [Mesorhizobium sp. CAU 1741]|uniref:hypothetical protein n=1 Tax=Mesorhizobium sp. CAU 1741 TaxID=3140366 RepID=UPI00325AFAA8